MKKVLAILAFISVPTFAEDYSENSLRGFVIPDLDPGMAIAKKDSQVAFCENLKKRSIVIDDSEASEILFSLLAKCKSL